MAKEPKQPKPPKPPKQPRKSKRSKKPDLASGIGNETNEPKKKGKLVLIIVIVSFALLVTWVVATAILLFKEGNAEATILAVTKGQSFKDTANAELAKEKAQLEADRNALSLRESNSITKEAELANQEQDLLRYQAELDSARQQLEEQTATTLNAAEELDKLVLIYEKMDPTSAAEIFSSMTDMNKLLQIFSRLKKEAAAKILTKMTPELASQITQQLIQ